MRFAFHCPVLLPPPHSGWPLLPRAHRLVAFFELPDDLLRGVDCAALVGTRAAPRSPVAGITCLPLIVTLISLKTGGICFNRFTSVKSILSIASVRVWCHCFSSQPVGGGGGGFELTTPSPVTPPPVVTPPRSLWPLSIRLNLAKGMGGGGSCFSPRFHNVSFSLCKLHRRFAKCLKCFQ